MLTVACTYRADDDHVIPPRARCSHTSALRCVVLCNIECGAEYHGTYCGTENTRNRIDPSIQVKIGA